MMTPEEFETRFLNLDVICQTRAEMIVAYRALWERERDNSDYISALCRAIESHCRGVAVPDDTAARCPYHAKRLNEHRMTEIGPTSETNAADSDAWELSRRGCECDDCRGRGNLPCDECGVDPSARYGQ